MSSPGTARPSTRRRPVRRLRPATSSTCPPAARRSSACGCRGRIPPTPLRRPRSGRASTRRLPRAAADADEFYNRITPPSLSEDERRVHRQALAGMLWGKQYYFFDVDTWLKEHEAHPLRRGGEAEGAERRLVPHVQRRHHLHARQVGISLVRRLGPGVPHDRWRSWTSTSPNSSSLTAAAEPLFPPERADSGLRVELQRREPARPRLGHPLSLQGGAGSRTRGHRVPGTVVPGPDA